MSSINNRPVRDIFRNNAARYGVYASLTPEFAKTQPRRETMPVRIAYNMNLRA